MLLILHTDFEQVFVTYVSTHLPSYLLLTYQLIWFLAHIHQLAIEEKKHNSHTKHILLQDQTYYFKGNAQFIYLCNPPKSGTS